MTKRCCTALIWIVSLGIAATTALSGGKAWAGGLSVVIRVQQDFYQPLVPVTKNFKTCFQTDSSGHQIIGICTQPSENDRAPAAAPGPKSAPSPTPKSRRLTE